MAKPALAIIGLFLVVELWNDWFQGLLYITNPNLVSLQYMLMEIQRTLEFIRSNSQLTGSSQGMEIIKSLPNESGRMALVAIVMTPMLFAYPAARVNGNIYGVPVYKEVGHQYGFLVNKNMADRNGIDLNSIENFWDMVEVFEIIKTNEPGTFGWMGSGLYHGALPVERISGNPSTSRSREYSRIRGLFESGTRKSIQSVCNTGI